MSFYTKIGVSWAKKDFKDCFIHLQNFFGIICANVIITQVMMTSFCINIGVNKGKKILRMFYFPSKLFDVIYVTMVMLL
jgi:hypothetical protein